MYGYFYVIAPGDGEIKKVKTSKTHVSCEDCYRFIGCDLVQMVMFKIGKTYCMILDEEGKLTGSEYNELATILYNNPYDFIVGKVVITKTDGWKVFSEEQAKDFEIGLVNELGHALIFKEENYEG